MEVGACTIVHRLAGKFVESVMNKNIDRIVLLGAAHGIVIDDLKQITSGSTFLYDKEHELQNVLLEAFAEMSFVVHQFQNSHDHLVAHGTPELDNYIAQLNEASFPPNTNFIVELHAFDLSTFFKSFLLLAKGVLDKLVPLYSYRFYDNLNQFSQKGTRLIRAIKNNKNVGKKTELISLIEHAKNEWIDALINLRDEYAHYSNLKEYRNFWIPDKAIGNRTFSGIVDFNKPTIEVSGVQREALGYMLMLQEKLIKFLQEFLQLCEFTPGRRPKHYLECECGYVFARKPKSGTKHGRLVLTSAHIEIQVKNREMDYGVIVCPNCGAKTDTDLQFWRNEGFIFSDTQPCAPGGTT